MTAAAGSRSIHGVKNISTELISHISCLKCGRCITCGNCLEYGCGKEKEVEK